MKGLDYFFSNGRKLKEKVFEPGKGSACPGQVTVLPALRGRGGGCCKRGENVRRQHG